MSVLNKVITYFGGSIKAMVAATMMFFVTFGMVLAPVDRVNVISQDENKYPSQLQDGPDVSDQEGVVKIIFDVANFFVYIIAGISVLVLIYGGFQYITDQGDGKGAEKGKTIVMNAVIGLVIAGLAFLIVQIVIGIIRASEGAISSS